MWGAAYSKGAENFDKVAMISRETIKFLSEDMPGIPFPFPYLTVYSGDFGMEYPMLTNVGPEADYGMTVYANSHEIAHGYFPFYVGTNETKNGWLDESLVVFMPKEIQTKLEPSFDVAKSNTRAISYYSGRESEPAIITPTYYLDANIYFYLNYGKAEQALRILEIHLGKQLFKECLKTFVDRWKYKHPSPYDFFFTFNDVSKQNLNWFWNAWYFQPGGNFDLSITNIDKHDKKIDVIIKNNGDLPIPSIISFYNNKKLIKRIVMPASDWKNNNTEIEISVNIKEEITHIILGDPLIPDSNPKDNEYIFK